MDLNLLLFTTKFFLNNDPKDFSVTDITDYPSTVVNTSILIQPAITFTQVEGIVKAELPSGTAMHIGSFGGPSDIDRDVTDTVSGLPITLDALGEVTKGLYSFTYTIRVTAELFQLPIVNIDINPSSSKYRVYVGGDFRSVNDDATLYKIINSAGGTNDGTYTLNVISYDTSNNQTIFEIDESLATVTPSGQFEITATRDYALTKTYDYQYTEPEAKIVMTHDINKSELSSDDQTNYGEYLTLVRTHTVKYPRDIASPPADIVQPLKKVLVNPIYTNNWTSLISTILEATTTDGLLIQATIEGTENHDVNVDDTLCECYQCIVNVFNNFRAAEINKNQRELIRWGGLAAKLGNELDLYNIARSCGKNTDAQAHLEIIKLLVAESGCTPTTNSNSKSILVIAVSAGGVSTVYNEIVSAWFSGSSDPLPGEHGDGDWYLNTTSGELFEKVTGAWVSRVTTIFGSDGTDGTIFHAGSGVPAGGLGAIGDFYIDSVTALIYTKTSNMHCSTAR